QKPDAHLPQSREEDRTRMDPGKPDESCQPKRCHKRDGTVGNPRKQRIMSAEMTDQKTSEQRADARAQRELEVSDGKSREHTDEPAEEYRQSHNNKVDTRAGSDDGADSFGRPLHHRFGADDAK